jgi:hypothetical protein
MNGSPRSKLDQCDSFLRASFDRPCSGKTGTEQKRTLFRFTENSSEGIAGNASPTVHTALAFNPTAQEAARQKTA